MQLLLEQTSKQRTAWIHHDSPSVKEVVDVFPCLADPQIVSADFELWPFYVLLIDDTGVLHTNWGGEGGNECQMAQLSGSPAQICTTGAEKGSEIHSTRHGNYRL